MTMMIAQKSAYTSSVKIQGPSFYLFQISAKMMMLSYPESPHTVLMELKLWSAALALKSSF